MFTLLSFCPTPFSLSSVQTTPSSVSAHSGTAAREAHRPGNKWGSLFSLEASVVFRVFFEGTLFWVFEGALFGGLKGKLKGPTGPSWAGFLLYYTLVRFRCVVFPPVGFEGNLSLLEVGFARGRRSNWRTTHFKAN